MEQLAYEAKKLVILANKYSIPGDNINTLIMKSLSGEIILEDQDRYLLIAILENGKNIMTQEGILKSTQNIIPQDPAAQEEIILKTIEEIKANPAISSTIEQSGIDIESHVRKSFASLT